MTSICFGGHREVHHGTGIDASYTGADAQQIRCRNFLGLRASMPERGYEDGGCPRRSLTRTSGITPRQRRRTTHGAERRVSGVASSVTGHRTPATNVSDRAGRRASPCRSTTESVQSRFAFCCAKKPPPNNNAHLKGRRVYVCMCMSRAEGTKKKISALGRSMGRRRRSVNKNQRTPEAPRAANARRASPGVATVPPLHPWVAPMLANPHHSLCRCGERARLAE